jgi:hypothetical protein
LAIVAVVAALIGLAGVAGGSADPDRAAAAAPGETTLKKAVWGATEVNGRSLFPAYKDLGIGLYQAEVRWYHVAKERPASPTDPDDPVYQWPPKLEAAIAEAASYGIQVSIRVMGSPRWANGNRNPRWIPSDKKDFTDFVAATAKKYPGVRIWIIWGEPNREANFAPLTPSKPNKKLTAAQRVAPQNYAQLLDSSYEVLNQVNSANLVVGGNTFVSAGANVIYPNQWIKHMRLPDGRRPRMDMYGHNPFGYRKPDLSDPPSGKGRVDFSDLGRFAKALNRTFPGPPLPLFLSEWGVQAGGDTRGPGFHVSLKEQAKWIRAGYGIARKWNRVYTLGWVHALDTAISPAGLMDSAGNPKPGYYVFRGA